ncbi:coiled-coil domain-containing protein 174 [Denticeps clupeoides]|uniref:CCDC174 alpha/beta GRSR domain-containing protein n=1 Tax=Denticeps clupeoides TaxID=299321 RepID=A0AAY4A1B0_9TELE|nr:coiled-coil domain-containing protein 174 [Denticeps clupeoides]
MDKKKKLFNVTSVSLVDLKAELYRKQQEFRKEKLCQDGSSKPAAQTTAKKPSIWSKQNNGVCARAQKDVEQKTEEECSLDKSKKKLEEKARLYDQMIQGNFPDEEAESLFLVDFTQKIINQKREMNTSTSYSHSNTEAYTHVPPPQIPDEEWVDYVDTFGRSRRCLKNDLPELQRMDQNLQNKRHITVEKTLLSEDMRREMQREEWEREEEERLEKPLGPIHYEDIREQEARDLGVGYFAFAQDEQQRKKQRETLDMLRDQTTEQRTKRVILKDKRKALLAARLAKVRMKKKMSSKQEGTEDEPAGHVGGDDHQEVKEDDQLEDTAEASVVQNVEVEIQERKDTKHGLTHIREWDRGKDFLWDQWSSRRREERDSEFAPPPAYFTYQGRNSHVSAEQKGQEKQKRSFNWSNTQSTLGQQAAKTHIHSQTGQEHTPPVPDTASQSLDELLSFYKHAT